MLHNLQDVYYSSKLYNFIHTELRQQYILYLLRNKPKPDA
jgi:hypothetical protein